LVYRLRTVTTFRCLLVVSILLTACGSPLESASAGSARWTIGGFSVLVPNDWKVQKDPDENGFNVIQPPRGEGRLLLLEIVDRGTPDITPVYALDHATQGISAIGLPTDDLSADKLGSDHYSVASEGQLEGRQVVANVHVFAPNEIVIGYFHTPQLEDPNASAARRILASVAPAASN
jgi:hypothetical protein